MAGAVEYLLTNYGVAYLLTDKVAAQEGDTFLSPDVLAYRFICFQGLYTLK